MNEFLGQFGPQIVAMLPSFIIGLVVGKMAKAALLKTVIISGAVLGALTAAGVLSIDAQTVREWGEAGSAWMGERREGASAYLATVLPSASAAAVGLALGFKR